eukprot:COSAG01_NODE_23_length_37704_cov_30.005877_49_plen_137_part_00
MTVTRFAPCNCDAAWSPADGCLTAYVAECTQGLQVRTVAEIALRFCSSSRACFHLGIGPYWLRFTDVTPVLVPKLRFHLGSGPYRLRFTYVTPVLIAKYMAQALAEDLGRAAQVGMSVGAAVAEIPVRVCSFHRGF